MPRKSSAANNAKRSIHNVRQIIGGNVKARRLALGWSQQELADRFGVSRAAVSQYEIGTGEVNAGDLPRLADILGISLLEFYEGIAADPMAGHGDLTVGHGAGRGEGARGGWAAETAARLLEKHGLLEKHELLDERPPVRSQVIVWKPAKGEAIALQPAGGVQVGQPEKDLAVLAQRFLSLPARDQETLSRVAEALQGRPAQAETDGGKPAQDGPAQNGPAQNGQA